MSCGSSPRSGPVQEWLLLSGRTLRPAAEGVASSVDWDDWQRLARWLPYSVASPAGLLEQHCAKDRGRRDHARRTISDPVRNQRVPQLVDEYRPDEGPDDGGPATS